MQLSQMFIYPVKSLRGIALSSSKVEARGLAYDRRWMIVDETGMFFTQRKFPEMTFITTTINDSHLILSHAKKSLEKLAIPLKMDAESDSMMVRIWDDTCRALTVSREADAWLSEALETNCRLVYMPDDTRRPTDAKYSHPDDIVSFADGYPFLIIGEASFDDLNEKLEEKISIHRFRPNFVFSGGSPYEEDNWQVFQIGNLSFRAVKPCARCQLPTVNPETAAVGKEPLRTLSSYRRDDNKVLFGMNACWNVNNDLSAIVNVGDRIEIIKDKYPK